MNFIKNELDRIKEILGKNENINVLYAEKILNSVPKNIILLNKIKI